ncbi:hypothetical protein LTR53_000838 [Teratosphaeriaceae sp. CCFEE 6253]|nr:hypothetical protein LTR53_000838 [Teratosphaeriaceae sp. CCFEE 6253]
MPLGFERINERKQRANANINFIKPDLRQSPADQAIAEEFLNRIAAQCYPVMKANYLSVMALEEFPPNKEFLGRNFNAGECIQLVLKDKGGRWLSFKFVQMVMMHELAHCKQMNHSRFFWNVRNEYAKQMEDLSVKGYRGEGLWGRGKDLVSGRFVSDRMPDDVQIPEHLCGGTYRRARGKKRKRGQASGEVEDGEKAKLSYAERQQKRIARKFGKHGEGNAIGDDELVRGALDSKSGKRHAGKPRVAKTLARFEAAKAQTPERTPELDLDGDSETESGWSSDEDIDSSESIILRRKAGEVKDHDGNDLVRVCGGEGNEDEGGADEMEELRVLSGNPRNFPEKVATQRSTPETERTVPPQADVDGSETESDPEEQPKQQANRSSPRQAGGDDSETESEVDKVVEPRAAPEECGRDNLEDVEVAMDSKTSAPRSPTVKAVPPAAASRDTAPQSQSTASSGIIVIACPICSLENERSATVCMACSHVLKPSLMKHHWSCTSKTCSMSEYINAGDVGRCGLCSSQRPAARATDSRPIGLISNDVLRWD